jgi:hypothetical protein
MRKQGLARAARRPRASPPQGVVALARSGRTAARAAIVEVEQRNRLRRPRGRLRRRSAADGRESSCSHSRPANLEGARGDETRRAARPSTSGAARLVAKIGENISACAVTL